MFLLLTLLGIGMSAFVLDSDSEELSQEDEPVENEHRDDSSEIGTGEDFVDVLLGVDLPDIGPGDEIIDIPLGDELPEAGLSEEFVTLPENQSLIGVDVNIDVASGIAELAGTDADVLVGGTGDDTFVMGENDVGIGGSGSDTFVVDGEVDGEVPYIKDFEIDKDLIQISLPSTEEMLEKTWPERPTFDGKVEISQDEDSTHIWVNGELACTIEGLHDISAENVEVLYDFYSDLSTDFDQLYGY